MSNTDFDPDDVYPNMVRGVQSGLRIASEVDPDNAARSTDLENSTGVPSTAISRNLDEFDAKYKAALSRDVILSNPRLMDYIRAHPMNGAISQNDWSNLDKVTDAWDEVHRSTVSPWWQRYPALLARGAGGETADLIGALGRLTGSEGLSGTAAKLRESVKSGIPLTDQDQTGIMAQILTGLGAMVPAAVGGVAAAAVGPELALPFGIGTGGLTMAGLLGLGHGEQVAEEAQKAGVDTVGPFLAATASSTALNLLPIGIVTRPWEKAAPEMINWGANALKRALATGTAMTAIGEVGQMIDSELAQWSYNPQAQYKPEVERMLANMAMGVFMGVGFDAFKAYVDAGKHIPPGTGSKELDELRYKQEEVTNKALDDLIARVADTDTPEHGQVGLDKLEEFLEQHPVVSTGFDADAVNKLYPEGTKPEPNDKILGWVPNIEQQLQAARDSGRDVRVPLSLYLKAVRADPEIDKTLHDARKVGKTGLSLDDIKNMSQAQQTADETQQTLLETPQIPRYVGGLADSGSPVLDTVRRSLALDRILPTPSGFWTDKPIKGILGRKDLGLRNEGATVPILAAEGIDRASGMTYPIKILGQTTGKEILSGIDLNKMPGATREVMTFFRDRESEIAGGVPVYIVSRSDMVKLRPSSPAAGYYDPQAHHVVLNADAMKTYSDNFIAHLMVHEYAHAATTQLINSDKAFRNTAVDMMKEFRDWLDKNEPDWQKNPDVNYVFHDPNAHEFIAQAWSSPEVIDTLARAGISPKLKNLLQMDTGQNSLWEGIKALVRQAFEKIFGKLPPTIMEGVFKWSGDVLEKQGIKYGEAKPPEPPKPPEPGEPIPPVTPPGPTAEELQMFADQRALGYPKKTWERLNKLLNDERERDVKWINDQSAKDAERYTKDWWKAEEDDLIKGEARVRTYAEPVISAERFLRFGYLGTEKLTKRKLNGEFLTDDQKAQLNTEYFQKGRGGLDPDRIAPWFGYRSGQEMVSDLINISNDMKLMGKSPNQYVEQMVKNRARQMMEEKHGTQAENILKEAQSRVISLDAINLVHADLERIAGLAGIDLSTPEAQARAKDLYGPITKEQLREMAVNELNTVEKRGDVDAEQLIDRAQKQGRAIENFQTMGKNIEAFKLSQSRMITMWKTYEMRDFEELEEKALAKTKRHVEREPEAFKSPDAAPFHDWIQLLMNHLGMNVRANPADILNVVMPDRGFKTFADFINKMNDPIEGFGGKTIPAPPWLRDLNFTTRKKIDDYTVGEARNIYETILAMDKMGREAKKVNLNDQKLEREPIVDGLIKEATESGRYVELPAKGKPKGHAFRFFDAVTMMPERFFNRMSGDNPRGFWNQFISRPITESANHYDAMDKEVGREYRKIMEESKIDLNKPMEAPVVLKTSAGGQFTSWTRENLITLMFNMGNRLNWSKMYKGRGLNDDQGKQLWSYVMKNATPEEWQFVSKMGELFYKIKREKVDPVYLRTVGFPPENIPVWDVVTPYGTFKGWYYPLVADRQAIGKGSKTGAVDVLDGADHFSLAIPNPHALERTGMVYPLSLSMQELPSRMSQILYDVAFKENLGEVGKLWYDPKVQKAITNFQGPERRDAIDAMLQRTAHHSTFNSAAAVEASRMNEFLRQNMMSFYVGLNIGTVIKHGPTAFVNSVRRIGAVNLARGYAFLLKNNEAAGESWNQWVNSQEEIQRRGRDWAERFGGAYKDFTQTTLAESIRNWGSKPVAFVDMLSSKAEFLGAYLKAIDEGQTENQAIFEASRSVRFSHGTTAPTNTPLIATGTGLHSWATSLYHFFGTMLQNRMEIAFRLNKMYRLGREGELKQAANLLPLIMGDVFAYVVFPTLIEEYATGLGREDRRGIGQRLGWATVGGLANAVPYARDIVHALEYGVNQEGGLADSAIQPLQQAFKDVSQAVEGKKQIYNAKYAGNLIQDLINLTGYVYGTPREIGNIAKYGWNVSTGVEVPHTGLFKEWFEWGDVGRGLTHGSQKMSKIK